MQNDMMISPASLAFYIPQLIPMSNPLCSIGLLPSVRIWFPCSPPSALRSLCAIYAADLRGL